MLKKIRESKWVVTIFDFNKKCNDDHVGAFGAMSAFFMILSAFPFLLLLLMLTSFLPFTKSDVVRIITGFLEFEDSSIIVEIINEIYRKAGISAFTFAVLTALWGSSRGAYSILLGLNSVHDIDENRNYFVLRFMSIIYTLLFTVCILIVILVWVFGKLLLNYFSQFAPKISKFVGTVIINRTLISLVLLTFVFMLIYTYIPNLPNKNQRLFKQWPGALFATVGWLVVSEICSLYISYYSGFSYVYGSMSWIMLLLVWLYWCMSMLFYGAEINYYLENKENYHELIRVVRPKYKVIRRANEHTLKVEYLKHQGNSVYYNPIIDGRSVEDDLAKELENRKPKDS